MILAANLKANEAEQMSLEKIRLLGEQRNIIPKLHYKNTKSNRMYTDAVNAQIEQLERPSIALFKMSRFKDAQSRICSNLPR